MRSEAVSETRRTRAPVFANGKLQRDAMLKHEHQRNLQELKEIQDISGELLKELEENTEFVLSLKSLKKLERLEKLSKDVRKRIQKSGDCRLIAVARSRFFKRSECGFFRAWLDGLSYSL
ncbi:MAG: hypothetical protein U5J83_00765 [Bryobacterales bacterium]|nr:hypothetical protein [Bryobacterales bacterium]